MFVLQNCQFLTSVFPYFIERQKAAGKKLLHLVSATN